MTGRTGRRDRFQNFHAFSHATMDVINAAADATPPPRRRTKASTVIDSPLVGLTPLKKGACSHGTKNEGKVKKTREAVVNEISNFIDCLAERGKCVSVHGDVTSCSCIADLKGKTALQKSVATAIICRHVDVSAHEKKLYLVECLRQASAMRSLHPPKRATGRQAPPHRSFFLPLSPHSSDPADNERHL